MIKYAAPSFRLAHRYRQFIRGELISIAALKGDIEKAFLDLTGHGIDSADEIEVKKYAHAGMSSGFICTQF